jgi:hypothetical protein
VDSFFEKLNRTFGEKRLADEVFLDLAKAFDTARINGLLNKLTFLKFPFYGVHTISLYARCRAFESSFQKAMSTFRGIQPGVAQGGLISPFLFRSDINNMPLSSQYVDLALYAVDTPIIPTSLKPKLLVRYLASYIKDLKNC